MEAEIQIQIACCICGKPAQDLRDFSRESNKLDIRFYCESCIKKVDIKVGKGSG